MRTTRAKHFSVVFAIIAATWLMSLGGVAAAQPPTGHTAPGHRPFDSRQSLRNLRRLLDVDEAPKPCEDSGALLSEIDSLLAAHPDASADAAEAPTLMDAIHAVVGAARSSRTPELDLERLTTLREAFSGNKANQGPTFYLPPGEPVQHPDLFLLERSQMYFLGHGVLIEAQIAPHILFWENVSRDAFREPGAWGVAWSFTPMVRLRILDITSSPIKTLSWMPKTDVLLAHRLNEDSINDSRRARLVIAQFRVGHHSNGQDESIFHSNALDSSTDPEPTSLDSVTINYPNGSFSTNYLQLGLYFKHYCLVPIKEVSLTPEFSPRSSVMVGLSFETNPPGLKIGGTLPEILRPLYGTKRGRAIAEWESRYGSSDLSTRWLRRFCTGSFRVAGSLEYLDKIASGINSSAEFTSGPLRALYRPGSGSSRWRWAIEGAWNPDALRGWGLTARYIDGQDYYNLLFFRDIKWAQFGITFDAGEFQRFGKGRFRK